MDQCNRTTRRALTIGAAAATALLFAAPPASADTNTSEGATCMQRVFMGATATVSGSTQLNCTANDVRISNVLSAINADTGKPSCVLHHPFTLQATFQTVVTATSRYDESYFFRIDGGANARGDGANASGLCSVTTLKTDGLPGSNLDGDQCGDLSSGTYSFNVTIPNVACEPAPGTTDRVRLPNCTSWHNLASTTCSPSNPFTSNPDTKSKCTCDDNFTIPLQVITATIAVDKTANKTTVLETGETVTYTVTVTNTAAANSDAIYTIDSITDSLYGNLGTNTPQYANNTCPSLIGTTVAAQSSASCHFDVFVQQNFVAGGNNTIPDTATFCGHDNGTNPTSGSLCASHDFQLTVVDVPMEPSVSKKALSAGVQTDVQYQVTVQDNSTTGDGVTVNSLIDNKFGDITTVHAANASCGTGQSTCEAVTVTNCTTGSGAVAITGTNYTCQFTGRIVTTQGSTTHTNHVTVKSTDSDGAQYTDVTQDVTVTINVSF